MLARPRRTPCRLNPFRYRSKPHGPCGRVEADLDLGGPLPPYLRVAEVLVELATSSSPTSLAPSERSCRCRFPGRLIAVLVALPSSLGLRWLAAVTDSVDAEVCTAAIFGSSSLGFFVLVAVTTRSASSGLVGLSCGSSASLTSAFCSGSCGEAALASVSGPGGRSVTSRWIEAISNPTSIAWAPTASSAASVCNCGMASAAPPTCSVSAITAAEIQSRRDGFCSSSPVTVVAGAACGAAGSGAPSSATSLILL